MGSFFFFFLIPIKLQIFFTRENSLERLGSASKYTKRKEESVQFYLTFVCGVKELKVAK